MIPVVYLCVNLKAFLPGAHFKAQMPNIVRTGLNIGCPSKNLQNLGIQNETTIGVTPDSFPTQNTGKSGLGTKL